MFYQFTPQSRFLLGTAGYPSPDILHQAIDASGAEIITASLRRQGSEGGAFRPPLQQSNKRILPNTAGCHTVPAAVPTAQLARELLHTSWTKL